MESWGGSFPPRSMPPTMALALQSFGVRMAPSDEEIEMKTVTTNQVLDALTEVAGTLDGVPTPARSANRAHDAAPDVDDPDASERLVRSLAEAIDSIASDSDLPPESLEDPVLPAHPALDTQHVPSTRS